MRHILVLALLAALSPFAARPAAAQVSASDMVMRLEALENQVRQLTGEVEQLQHRNQQLERQLQAALPQDPAVSGSVRPQAQPQPTYQPSAAPPPPRQAAPPALEPSPIRPVSPAMPGRRSDVYDPSTDPNAPGAPRPLGSLPAGQPSAPLSPNIAADESVGDRGGREVGAPLDLSTVSSGRQAAPQGGPQGPGGQYASVNPTPQTPREQFDLGYGYIQRKDYALAENAFRDFIRRYPSDRMAPDAQFWLGESLFQRQRYRDAAESFLAVSTKFETSPLAPNSLLRLGQSLAAMDERDAACATLGEVGRKYPRASLSVRQGVERELKRARC
ncbi:MAG: tol-pal system protein YbgF [Pseudorhodoplanes sp.]|nr:tol-pal system protein YbgF [Pseudorhodoplanes sp.]